MEELEDEGNGILEAQNIKVGDIVTFTVYRTDLGAVATKIQVPGTEVLA